MDIVIIIIQIVLACMFLLSFSLKVSRAKSMVHHWNEYRYPKWLMNVIALLELTSAIGVIIGFWHLNFLKYSAILIIFLMLGALHAHFFRAKHKIVMTLNAFLMLILSVVVLLFSQNM
ncbi:DoxX family protein [Bacillus pseudomycoides]|uniref:DoxX family protein n=1 Tax=Bacillus bingmayongensis TaxID=1150157 RepID=A0ABU5JT08_9BACI|nr:DoxX family protein [Bacillus pseudomycoides]